MIEILINYSQSLVTRRRKKIKVSRLEETKLKLLPHNSFQDRNSYIERSINDSMKYFNSDISMNDTEKDKKDKHMMLHLRRKLIKQECEIVRMKMRKEEEERVERRRN